MYSRGGADCRGAWDAGRLLDLQPVTAFKKLPALLALQKLGNGVEAADGFGVLEVAQCSAETSDGMRHHAGAKGRPAN